MTFREHHDLMNEGFAMYRVVLCIAAALLALGTAALSAPGDSRKACRDGSPLSSETIAACSRAIARNPKDAVAISHRGLAYASKGDFDRAMADLNKAIALNPKFARGYGNLAAADELRGDAGAAIAHADEAIRLDPKDGFAFNVRGKAHLDRGEFAAAVTDFDEALRLDPALAEARHDRDRAQAAAAISNTQAVAALPPDQAVPPPARVERRVALVIGNAQYRTVPALASPSRDAEAVAAALRDDGFQTVMLVHDLDRRAMHDALRAFREIADAADWAVIYYAGHGIQLGNAGYLVPVDATLENERDARDETLSYDEIQQAAGGARELRLVIIDASRTDPFTAPTNPPDPGGLRSGLGPPADVKSGTLVVYSTRDGHVAEQNGNATSPFATALVTQLRIPGREVRRLFDYVRDDVLTATGLRQEPFMYGSLPGGKDFYFIAKK